MMAIASRSVRWNAFSRESFIHTVMRCSSPVLYDYIVVSYVLYDITTGVKIDRLCTCIVLHAPRAPRATSQISVTFRRDTMVDVADPDVPSASPPVKAVRHPPRYLRASAPVVNEIVPTPLPQAI